MSKEMTLGLKSQLGELLRLFFFKYIFSPFCNCCGFVYARMALILSFELFDMEVLYTTMYMSKY